MCMYYIYVRTNLRCYTVARASPGQAGQEDSGGVGMVLFRLQQHLRESVCCKVSCQCQVIPVQFLSMHELSLDQYSKVLKNYVSSLPSREEVLENGCSYFGGSWPLERPSESHGALHRTKPLMQCPLLLQLPPSHLSSQVENPISK